MIADAARAFGGTSSAGLALALALALQAVPAGAADDWQIGHGSFVSAADVSNHNRMPLDIRDVNQAMSEAEPDWQAALERFAFGKHFANHSLAIFTDDYNGRLTAHLPVTSRHFGTPAFQNHQLSAALVGSGSFRRAGDSVRAAFVSAGLQAVVINWSRYELGESRRKALLAEPNWSLENGSPKNWNEIFAFYWGPDGRHSAYQTVSALPGGDAVNDALLEALADGQDELVAERWTPVHAARVAELLDRASVLMLEGALRGAAEASPDDRPAALARAAGYWLAAAEPVATNRGLASRVEMLLWGDPTKAELVAAADSLAALF